MLISAAGEFLEIMNFCRSLRLPLGTALPLHLGVPEPNRLMETVTESQRWVKGTALGEGGVLASNTLLTDRQSQWSPVVRLVQKGDMGEGSCSKLIT